MTVKEIYRIQKIRFVVLSHGEPSFLDLQEVGGGVDGWGMALDVLFSWISTCFLTKNYEALDCDLGFV